MHPNKIYVKEEEEKEVLYLYFVVDENIASYYKQYVVYIYIYFFDENVVYIFYK